MIRHVPDWVQAAVFYQIFPDRFRRDSAPWHGGAHLCSSRHPCHGNLQGIIEAIPYLEDLGITALYLTPIFHAGSYHKYDTIDYFQIDPCFGDNAIFRRLVEALHAKGMRIVLDGVFNHCSNQHPFFLDAAQNATASAYWDWFTIRGSTVQTGDHANYDRWAGVTTMPEWNHRNPAVVKYLLSVVRHWIEIYHIDGWRLDTTEYLPPDFVRAIFQEAKSVSSDAYVLGEVMGLGTPWFRHGAVDGVMHYKLWEALGKFLAEETWDAEAFAANLHTLWHSYPEEGNYASYTLLSSHDKPRFLTQCQGDVNRLRLALAFQFTFPGPPAVYYGDEIGLEGGEDPDNRRCFPWNEGEWNLPLLSEVRDLIRWRRDEPALSAGSIRLVEACGRLLAYERALGSSRFLVTLNAAHTPQSTGLPSDAPWVDAFTHEPANRSGVIPPQTYRVFRRA